ncbi:MAG: type I-E CRISPR-associated protein Cas5/CasD [Limisphaerales bacterium]
MSAEAYLPLWLDAPMQSWGHQSRYDQRTTGLDPTRSGVIGLIAAAMGIDKHSPDELAQLATLNPIGMTTVKLPRTNNKGDQLSIERLEDYHTITGYRRASGKVAKEATVQSYRHYLLDARFGVLLEGPKTVLDKIAAALKDPVWGVWLGRKCCPPAAPVLVADPCEKSKAWRKLLQQAGYTGEETLEQFDHVIEVASDVSGADVINDQVVGFGQPIGERHAPRWIERKQKSKPAKS